VFNFDVISVYIINELDIIDVVKQSFLFFLSIVSLLALVIAKLELEQSSTN